MKDCPCGTGFPYTDCCGPLIRGSIPADTAEDLMRSRFTAFAKRQWDYIEQTRYPDGRELSAWYKSKFLHDGISWTKLDVLSVKSGEASDDEGEVGFVAHYTENGEEKTLQEVSRFIREDGKWYYCEHESRIISSKPTSSSEPFTRDQPKVGRNDPCSCGSNKKYKKCCGK
ncbi:MAG: YchJ family metal-binding protein [Nitrospinaceae bacterium]|jgi:SEC-C motif-containing protein|nr:YchJ family metal-binding protein [Nitrospinaceae bacterium]|tara:strand:- start:8374 stop:8886 length:513 start_codon:yes stop_codon:yes gene_type:complete